MICFRVRSFCSAFPEACGNASCARAFTDAPSEAARKWWGSDGAPVMFSDFSDGCTDIKTPDWATLAGADA